MFIFLRIGTHNSVKTTYWLHQMVNLKITVSLPIEQPDSQHYFSYQ